MQGRTMGRLRPVLLGAAILLAATWARGAETLPEEGELSAVEGTATEISGFASAVRDLDTWDLDEFWVGTHVPWSTRPYPTLAADADGRVYACVSGFSGADATRTTVDLSTAVADENDAVTITNKGYARLNEKAGVDVVRMTFPSVGEATPGMEVRVTAKFKEPSGNSNSFHVYFADADTGEEYDDWLFELERSSTEENEYIIFPRYPLVGKDLDVICEIRRGEGDGGDDAKLIIKDLALVDYDPKTGTTGIVRYDPNDTDEPYKTIHDRAYGWVDDGEDGRFYYGYLNSVILAPVSTAFFDEGDLLFLQAKADNSEAHDASRTSIYALAPDGEGSPSLVASVAHDTGGIGQFLGVLGDGSLVLGGQSLYRLDYVYDDDAGAYAYAETKERFSDEEVFASVVGPNGEYVYVAMRDGSSNDRSKEVFALDPYDPDAEPVSVAMTTSHVGQTRGLVFDTEGTLWWGGRKDGNYDGAPRFLGYPRGNKNRINYNKRIVEWTIGVRTIVAGLDGDLYVLTQDADDVYRVWQVQP